MAASACDTSARAVLDLVVESIGLGRQRDELVAHVRLRCVVVARGVDGVLEGAVQHVAPPRQVTGIVGVEQVVERRDRTTGDVGLHGQHSQVRSGRLDACRSDHGPIHRAARSGRGPVTLHPRPRRHARPQHRAAACARLQARPRASGTDGMPRRIEHRAIGQRRSSDRRRCRGRQRRAGQDREDEHGDQEPACHGSLLRSTPSASRTQ